MRISNLFQPRLLLLQLCFALISVSAWSQTGPTASRVIERVNENALVTLSGNTHPLAQPQFDQGAAPPDLPMARMLLVLKRSDAQEAALEKLLDDQQNQNSPSFHQWLTPDQFGQQFGPSDQDMQAIAAWLQSHGFQVTRVARGRTVIEFSGTAAQVTQAFHTEIHKYSVNGVDHWANAGDPQIPQALAPVIVGVNSMHNFAKAPSFHIAGLFSKSRVTGKVESIQRNFTIQNPEFCPGAGDCYFLGPYDFATIYNVLPLWNGSGAIDGTGQNIAIIGRSDINIQDVRNFRNLFGLPPNDPKFFVDGTDPGIVPGDETEADLDVEWSGAVAKGATINLVTSASTESTDGVDLSAVYAIENNLAPIISESFGQCELFLGAAGNSFQSGIRQQAAAQGITFITSSGDSGSAGCDSDSRTPPAPATYGLMVSGLASTPYGIAVGGTDFLNFGPNYTKNSLIAPSPYWSATNDAQEASALGYVPESTWNSTCTNNIFVILGAGFTPEASCNNFQLAGGVQTVGAGGGKSNCTSPSGMAPSNCSGGYAKPSWQSAPGVPADGARDVPDVSLFASSGFMGSAYILCESDQSETQGSCGLTGIDYDFLGIGGTSASAPAFAGIMALVNQYTNSSGQGNANTVLYKLASSSTQTKASCNSSLIPASGCIFNDVTSGVIAMPCAAETANCNFTNANDTYGVLAGYGATAGYDQATGLGSVNAYNLVHNWSTPGLSTSTTLSINSNQPVTITHGQSVSLNISVSPSAATGEVSLIGSPTTGSSVAMGQFALQNGAANGTTTALAGGTSYQVKAHYAGDSVYAPSDSASITVTVAPEPSTTLISIPTFDPNTGKETGNNPPSLVYGSSYFARVDVGNASAALSFPAKPVCAQLTCPTGIVTLSDSVSGGASGTFALNSEGYADDFNIQLSGGVHQLSASYPGDNSYKPSTGNYTLTVTPAPTTSTIPFVPSIAVVGTQTSMSVAIDSNVLLGAVPTGTVTFYDGSTPISGTVTLSGQAGTTSGGANLYATGTANFSTSGTHVITAKYSGDANYAGSTSPPSNISALYPTTAAENASATTVNFGSTLTLTATVISPAKAPQMTGTFQFNSSGTITTLTPTLSTDMNGNQVLTASATVSPQNSNYVTMTYSGDSNYESSAASVFITVILPDFGMGTTSSNISVPAGQSGSTQLTLTPINNISSTVTLTCNTPIAGATCSFNPASLLSLSNGAPASTTFTIATLPPSSSMTTSFIWPPSSGSRRIPPPGLWTIGFGNALAMLLICILFAKRRNRLASRGGLAGLLCLILGCGASNGGGGGGGSQPVATTITLSTGSVKVAAGSTVSFAVTVNSSKTATGSVNLLDYGTTVAQSTVVNGVATIPVNFLSIGAHSISAQYTGDTNNQPSRTAGAINQVITGTSTAFIVANSPQVSHTTQINVTVQ